MDPLDQMRTTSYILATNSNSYRVELLNEDPTAADYKRAFSKARIKLLENNIKWAESEHPFWNLFGGTLYHGEDSYQCFPQGKKEKKK